MKKSLFVVEDDEYIRRDLCDILESEGYAVSAFPNGLEALAALEQQATRPDLVILDLMMPVLNGYEFIQIAQGELPILVMSADGRVDARLKGVSVQGVLKKPLDLEVFLNSVEKLSSTM